jgi:hypothetical protein
MSYRTMQGREVDMEKLMRQNELVPAIGNMNVNARGDELGSGGKIIRRREEIVADYYDDNPNAQPMHVASEAAIEEEVAPVVAPTTTITKSIKKSEE